MVSLINDTTGPCQRYESAKAEVEEVLQEYLCSGKTLD